MHNGTLPARPKAAKSAFRRAHDNQKKTRKPPAGWSIKTKAQAIQLARHLRVPRLEPPGMAQARRHRLQVVRNALRQASMKLRANVMRTKQGVPVKAKAQPTPRRPLKAVAKKPTIKRAFTRARDNRQRNKPKSLARPQRQRLRTAGERKVYSPQFNKPARERIANQKRQRIAHPTRAAFKTNSREVTVPKRISEARRKTLRGRTTAAHRRAVRPMVRKQARPQPVARPRAAQQSQLVKQTYARQRLQTASTKVRSNFSRSR